MSNERGPAYLESVYLFGTPDEIVASLQARVDAGVEYFFLHTMTPDPAQLQMWIDEIIPNVTFPATAGPVRRPPTALASMTRRVALLGKPLRRRHSLVMHDAAFDAAGIDAPVRAAGARRGRRSQAAVAAAHGPEWLGLGRHRAVQAARCRRCVDEVEVRRDARSAPSTTSSAPTTGRLVGFNSDAPGFRAGVELRDGPAARPGAAVVVAGAGGAAHAVVHACLDGGRARLTIGNRTPRRPRRSRRGSRASGRGRRASCARRGRVRDGPARRPTWPSTRRPSAWSIRARRSTSTSCPTQATVFDLVYVPAETPLLAAARARGLRAANGSEMLIAQAAIAFERWTGDRRHGRRDARGGRAAARRPDGAGLSDAPRDDRRADGSFVRRGRRDDDTVRCRSAGGRRAAAGVRGARRRSRRRSSALRAWARARSRPTAWRAARGGQRSGPAVPDPGAIYTIGAQLPRPGRARRPRPGAAARLRQGGLVGRRPRRGARLGPLADGQRRRGVRAGRRHRRAASTSAEDALAVFGYTIINDVSSRDAWLDGDQWLLGKSMPGFCPVGPWIVTADELDPSDLAPRLHDQRRGRSRTAGRRRCASAIAAIIAYLSRHLDAPARRPDRDRHAGPPRDAARARPPAPARRHRDLLDRGHRRADHPHRLIERGADAHEAADRVPGRDDQPRGRGVPRASHDT